MKFFVKINIMPQDALLDPQGKTIENNTVQLGIEDISNIRVGKCVSLELDSENETTAKETIKQICEKLLVNQITEQYTYEILNN
tara:strand:- start:9 stop:260 length:252 start_codon:yes stop_codon:yes gene_type:complete